MYWEGFIVAFLIYHCEFLLQYPYLFITVLIPPSKPNKINSLPNINHNTLSHDGIKIIIDGGW